MRMNKKKSSLALVLVMLLTVVVGVAWAAGTLVDFNYSTTYATPDFTIDHSADVQLPATNMSLNAASGD